MNLASLTFVWAPKQPDPNYVAQQLQELRQWAETGKRGQNEVKSLNSNLTHAF